MDTTILQVPIDKSLRDKATSAAHDQGFSSLQEVVRLFLHQVANKTIDFRLEPKPTQLSPKAIRRYNKISAEIESGKTKLHSFDTVDEMFKYLNS